MKKWIHASKDYKKVRCSNINASTSFDTWYDSLSSADQEKVDDLADDMGLPLYAECSEAELAQLHDLFVSNMKKWIHASKEFTPDPVKEIGKIKKAIKEYTPEQLDYVKECQKELTDEISAYYEAGDDVDPDYDLAGSLHSIKSDYLLGAVESDLMSAEEFLNLLDLIDKADTEKAISVS